MQRLYVVSLIYPDKRDTGIHFQAVGPTVERAIDSLNVKLAEWRDEHFGDELDDPECGAPALFQLDGAWTDEEPTEPELPLDNPNNAVANDPDWQRVLDVEQQLNRWLSVNMDAYVADFTMHDIVL